MGAVETGGILRDLDEPFGQESGIPSLPRCRACPIQKKIAVYQEAGKNPELALILGRQQGIGEDEEKLVLHFERTAATILIGCKTLVLCKIYNRLDKVS